MKTYVFQKLDVKTLTWENVKVFTSSTDAILAAMDYFEDLSGNCLVRVYQTRDEYTIRAIRDNSIVGLIVCKDI